MKVYDGSSKEKTTSTYHESNEKIEEHVEGALPPRSPFLAPSLAHSPAAAESLLDPPSTNLQKQDQ